MADDCKHGREVCLTCAHQRGYADGVKAALAAVRGRGAAIDNGTVTGKTVAAVVLEAVDEAEKALVKT